MTWRQAVIRKVRTNYPEVLLVETQGFRASLYRGFMGRTQPGVRQLSNTVLEKPCFLTSLGMPWHSPRRWYQWLVRGKSRRLYLSSCLRDSVPDNPDKGWTNSEGKFCFVIFSFPFYILSIWGSKNMLSKNLVSSKKVYDFLGKG